MLQGYEVGGNGGQKNENLQLDLPKSWFQCLFYLLQLTCQRKCHQTGSKEVPKAATRKPTYPAQGRGAILITEEEFSELVSKRHRKAFIRQKFKSIHLGKLNKTLERKKCIFSYSREHLCFCWWGVNSRKNVAHPAQKVTSPFHRYNSMYFFVR